MATEQTIQVAVGDFIKPLRLKRVGKHIECRFGFNRKMIATVKALEGAHWCGYDDDNPRKIWTISASQHNEFRLRYMMWLAKPLTYRKANLKEDPYYRYDLPLFPWKSDRPLYDHQGEMASLIVVRKCCEFACEMGTGKTLAAIEAAEYLKMQTGDVWYVGPKAGCKAVPRELRKWECNHDWRFFTYEELVKYLKNIVGEIDAPKMFIIDEASKVKNPSAQRSQSVAFVADAVRSEHGNNGYVVEMSGSPSPKDPSDWWHQVRIIAPGFIKEGSKQQFKRDLCLIEQRDGLAGGTYPHLITWWDDIEKCAKCGGYHDARDFDGDEEDYEVPDFDHDFVASVDKVGGIYKRLKGLVLVKFKKDCLDLPEKREEIIDIMPTPSMLRTAKMIVKHGGRAVQVQSLLRQLSDGFQYKEVKIGENVCPECKGDCKVMAPVPQEDYGLGGPDHNLDGAEFKEKEIPCGLCKATGKVPRYERQAEIVGSPKDEVFTDDLDEHEEGGRYIVWGGFQATIDRLVDMAHKNGWATLRIDGRGYQGMSATGEILDDEEMLDAMDASFKNYDVLLAKYPKICLCGNPEAGGMALTLTASPTSAYYSNSFKGEARIQSLERGHRAGMPNWTHTIKDFVCLPSDQLVLDNLNKKLWMQAKSLGQVQLSMDEIRSAFN